MSELERGCGYRKIGGAYLVGTGLAVPCDALPLELVDCSCCGFKVPFSRNIIKIHGGYLAGRLRGHQCRDEFPCPICSGHIDRFYIMYVSQKLYTPESFMAEALAQGVSKRIPPQSIPKDLALGQDWIMLAMFKYPLKLRAGESSMDRAERGAKDGEEWRDFREAKAVFYAFKPERKEILLWSDTPNAVIRRWEKQGFTPVLIEHTPENEAKHGGE
jgi:hypothetical protein